MRSGVEIGPDHVRVVIGVRHGLEERGRVVGKQCMHGVDDAVLEAMVLEPAPEREQERARIVEHPAHLAEARPLVGNEHDPERARDEVEGTIVEGQLHRIRRPPCRARRVGATQLDHLGAEVGRRDRGAGDHRDELPRQGARAGRQLQHAPRPFDGHAPADLAGARREHGRHEAALVGIGHRLDPPPVAILHGPTR